MWVAKFRLKDDDDIYSPACTKFNVDFFAFPYTHFKKGKTINFLLGGIIIGSSSGKNKFISQIKKDKRVVSLEKNKDFLLLHTTHPSSREQAKEISIFYNPQYLLVKPVHASSDGWEYWEVGCIDRKELNRLVMSAKRNYHGKLFSLKQEKVSSVSSLAVSPGLSEKQRQCLDLAVREGYYEYPRRINMTELAKIARISYSTFQEHLSRAEAKVLKYFYNYR